MSIVGTDEIDLNRHQIGSWVSPLARALTKSAAGDSVVLQAPGLNKVLDGVRSVLESSFPWSRSVGPPGSEASSKRTPGRP